MAVLLAVTFSRWLSRPEPQFEHRPVSAWALDLQSASAATREKAAEVVRRFRGEEIPPLVEMLRTPDPVFGRPIRAISARAPNRVNRLLFRIINPHEAPSRRAAAALAFRSMGSNAAPAAAALRLALFDDKTVSWHAALALAQLGEPGLNALMESLLKLPPAQCGYACYALSTRGQAASNAIPALKTVLLTYPREATDPACDALQSMGRLAIPALIEAMAHTNLHVQLCVASSLGNLGSIARDAVPHLIEMARHAHPDVRARALDALAKIRPASELVVSALINGLRDPERPVRLKAIRGLSQSSAQNSKLIRDAVLAMIRDESPEIRCEVADLLGTLGDDGNGRVTAALSELRTDANVVVRERADAALKRMRSPAMGRQP